ncbi:MAG: hypothetical protein QM539_10140, partial [Alphaproteobacteria bacterium]|nr:hypothetical protein [Alphaproteobacteria bacterium]
MIALELLIDESCNKDLLHSKETLNLTTHKLVTELQIKSLKLWYDSTQLEIETALKQNSKYSISSNTTPINPLIVALKNKIKWEKAYTYHKKTDSTKLLNVAVPIFYDSRNGFYVRLATTLDYTTHKKTAYFIVSLMDSLFFVHHKEAAFNDKFSGAFVVYNLEGRREALLHYKNGMRNAQGQQAQHTFKYSAKTAEFQNTLSGVYLRKTEFTNVLMNCNPPCIVDSWMWCCECGDGVVTDISCNNDWWNSNPNLIEDLPGVIVDGSYPSSGGGGYPDLGGGYYPPPPDNGDGGGGSSSNDSDPVEVDPCDATKRAAAQNATNQSQQTNYNAAKGEISAAGNDREHTITIDANGNKS